jgi:hypothetical protein
MRRALRKSLPALSRYFGILPHHLDDMTVAEVNEYLEAARRLSKG